MEDNTMPGGYLVGNSHADGGIKIKTPEGQIEAEGGEVIINKRVLVKDDKFVCEGTPKEITSKINEMEGGVSWSETGSCKLVRKAEDGTEIEEEGNISDDGFGLLYTKNNKKFIVTADTKDQIELIDMAIKDYKDGLIDKENLENTLQSYMNDEEEFTGHIVYNNGKPFVYNDFYRGYIELYDEMPIDVESSEIEFALGGGIDKAAFGYAFGEKESSEMDLLPKEKVREKLNNLENEFQAIRLEFRNNALTQEEYFNEKQDLINRYSDCIDAAKRHNMAINQSLFIGITQTPKMKEEKAARGTILRSSNPEKRPSPSVSATIYPEGYEMEGNDGNMWVITIDSRGVHRWKRLKAEDGAELEGGEQHSIEQAKERIATNETELFTFNDSDTKGVESYYRFKEDIDRADDIYFDFTYDFYKGEKYLCSAQVIFNDFEVDVEDFHVDKWDYARESHYTEAEGYSTTYSPTAFYVEETVDADGRYLELSDEDMKNLKAEIGAIFKEKIMYYSTETLAGFQLKYGELLDILKKHNIEKAADGKDLSSCGCSHSKYEDGGGVGENIKSYRYGFDTCIQVDGTNYGGKLVLGRGKVRGKENVYLSHIDWDENNVPENSEEIEEYVDKNLNSLLQNAQQYNNGGGVAARGKVIVTKIEDIPNLQQELKAGRVTYRGLGLGKLYDDFYEIANESGTRIKVEGKEYYITDTDFRKLNWDEKNKKWKNLIKFSAPQRRENGGETENTGLIVTGKTTLDNNSIGDVVEEEGYYAEWNARDGYWFFPEEIDMYDSLEKELDNHFGKRGINARFEGVFKYNNGGGINASELKKNYDNLSSALEKQKVPSKIKLTDRDIIVELGWNYPDRLADKVFDAAESLGININTINVCAESSGDTVLESKRTSGGAKRYDDGGDIEQAEKGKELWFTPSGKLSKEKEGTARKMIEMRLAEMFGAVSMNLVGEDEKHFIYELEGNPKRIEMVTSELQESKGLDVETYGRKKRVHIPKTAILQSATYVRFPLLTPFKNGGKIIDLPYKYISEFPGGIYLLMSVNDNIEKWDFKYGQGKVKKITENEWKKYLSSPSLIGVGTYFGNGGDSAYVIAEYAKGKFNDGGKLEMLNDVPKGYLYLSNIINTSRKPNGKLTDVYKTNLSHIPANQIEQVNLYLQSLDIDYTMKDDVPHYNPNFSEEDIPSTENYLIALQVSPEKVRYFFVDTQGYDYPRYVTELINYNPEYYDNGGKINENELETIKGYERKSKEDYDNNLKLAKGDDEMISMYRRDFSDHVFVATLMRDGKWEMALETWRDMDTAARENISNDAYELLMGKNNLPTYRDGGGVGEIEMELELIKKKYPNAKVSYYFTKNPNGKNYVIQAKENGKIVYSSYQHKYANGGGIESSEDKVWQIKKGNKYYSIGLQDGQIKWSESPDLGYSYDYESAEKLANYLREEHPEIEIVKYDKDWWKKEDGGSIAEKFNELKSALDNAKQSRYFKESDDKYLYLQNVADPIINSADRKQWNALEDYSHRYSLNHGETIDAKEIKEQYIKTEEESNKMKDGGEMVMENEYAKGGEIVKYYSSEDEHRLSRPSSDIEKELLEKVDYYDYLKPLFIGNFGWKTPQGKLADGYLFELDEYDMGLIGTLKPNERVFRYINRMTAISGSKPLIKINLEKGLLYFLTQNEDYNNDDIVFETRGVKASWISLMDKKAADGKTIEGADYLTNAMLSILDLHAYVSANDNKIRIFGSEYTYMSHSKYNLRVTGGKGAVYNIIPYFPTSTVEKLQQAHFYTLVRQGRSYNFAITKQNEVIDLAEDGIQILTIS